MIPDLGQLRNGGTPTMPPVVLDIGQYNLDVRRETLPDGQPVVRFRVHPMGFPTAFTFAVPALNWAHLLAQLGDVQSVE